MDRSTSSSVSDDECRSTDQEKTHVLHNPERRKRRRRGKKRKWKPYSKMTAEERKASLTKQSGLLGAPSNTTQFIMEDRGEAAVHYPSPSRLARSVSYDSSPSGWVISMSLPSPEMSQHSPFHFLLGDDDATWQESSDEAQEPDAFLEEDFNQVYAQLRMDRLDHMSKDDLVHQCMDLEERVVTLQEEKDQRQEVLQKELSELKEKNSMLLEENQRLRTGIPTSVS